jgi:ABC-2 type transport system ATP-binding protein
MANGKSQIKIWRPFMVATNLGLIERDIQRRDDARAAVEISGVSRRFGVKLALDDVSLTVPTGTVLGLVGENGAGKTTLIKHVLGLLKAQSGSVRVLGHDPVAEPVRVLARLGYLSEEPDMPGWMRVHELLRYVAAFYPTWDSDYAEQLRRDFGLDPLTKVKHLSKGQRARVGLVAALAYRPDLLVLDEPSSGLDPIVRRDILGAIIRTIAEEGRTVLFSSHLLSEVERVSDRIAMIKSGRVLFCDTLEGIQRKHARLTLRFELPHAKPPQIPGALAWEGRDREWTAVCDATDDQLRPAIKQVGASVVEEASLNLDEIFVARAGGPHVVMQTE